MDKYKKKRLGIYETYYLLHFMHGLYFKAL